MIVQHGQELRQGKNQQHVGFTPVGSIPSARRGRPAVSKYDSVIQAAQEHGCLEVENPDALRPRVLYSVIHARIKQIEAPVRACVRGGKVYLERMRKQEA